MTKKLFIASDIHGNFARLLDSIKDINYETDIIILAGDILSDSPNVDFGWVTLTSLAKHIIYVPGNHEFINPKFPIIKDIIKKIGITTLDNNTTEIDNINIIGTTLWSDISNNPIDEVACRLYLPEFRLISLERYRDMHKNAVGFINSSIKDNMTNVVVTHHAPSIKSISSRWAGNALNSGFYSELDIDSRIKLWVHGHTHDIFNYYIGETNVVCNPLGYSHESTNFKDNFYIEV